MCDWLLVSVCSYCYSILHFICLHCMCLQGGDGDSDLLSADQRPSVKNERLRLQVSTRQEPRVRGSDGVCGPPCTVYRHRRLLRYCLLRDTSFEQNSASRSTCSRLGLSTLISCLVHFSLITRPQDRQTQDSASTLRLYTLYTLASRLDHKMDMLKTRPQHFGLMPRSPWPQDSSEAV